MTVASPSDGQWLRPNIEGLSPAGRGGHSCVAVGNQVIIFGGADRAATPFDDLYALELGPCGRYTWTRVQAQLAAGLRVHSRTGASLTVVGSDVFLFGGQEPSTGLCFNDVLRLDTKAWSWSKVLPVAGVPPARHSHCAGLLRGNCILVYGGASQTNSIFGDVWIFNTDSKEWTRVDVAGSAPPPREMATGTMLDDSRMLVVGGRSRHGASLADMAVLDMNRCAWRIQPSQPVTRCAHSAVLLPSDSFSSALLERLRGPDQSAVPLSAPRSEPQEQQQSRANTSTSSDAHSDAPVLVLFGGFADDKVAGDIMLVDTGTMACKQLGSGFEEGNARAAAPRFAHSAVVVPSIRGAGKQAMLVFGGVSCGEEYSDVCVWYP